MIGLRKWLLNKSNDGNVTGKKNYYSYQGLKYINDWINSFAVKKDSICTLFFNSNDFQHQKFTYLSLLKTAKSITAFPVNQNNLINACIYFTVRLCFESDWLNDRDQFLFPNDDYKTDIEFQNDSFTFSLFHGQNRVSFSDGVNHWIPYLETEVNAKDNFESHFLHDFITGNIDVFDTDDLFSAKKKSKSKALKFSNEAKSVFKAGKKLWQYYHSQPTANVNAGLYDIREFFQSRDDNGKMNNTSGDDNYNELIGDLRSALKILALKIQPKVYEYGFLMR